MQPRTHRHRQLLQKKGITPSIPYIPQAIPPPPLAQAQAGGGGSAKLRQNNQRKIRVDDAQPRFARKRGDLPSPGGKVEEEASL